MKARCPGCGATSSLDVLIGHEAASTALDAALKLSGDLRRPLIAYLGLFRPATKELTFERVAKLLNDIQPDIERGMIRRNRVDYPAPIEVWISAMDATIKARDNSKLTPPLKDHSYLYACIANTPTQQAASHVTSSPAPKAKAKAALPGVDPADMYNHLLQHRRGYETTDETYDRLLKEQNQ